MKIVYCLIDSSRSGGMERSVCVKANYLADTLGYDITILTTDRGDQPSFFDFSPRIRFIDLDINYKELEQQSFCQSVFNQLKKRKLHRQRLEKVLMELHPDICISTCTHEFTILPRIKDGSCKIAEFHFCRNYKKIEYDLLPVSFWVKQKAIWGEKNKYRYINKYDRFVVLTEKDARCWSEFSNVLVIPNVLPFYPETGSFRTERRVISMGRLSIPKGFHYLIDVWCIVNKARPDWVLDIYGTGEEYSALIEHISRLGLSGCVSIHMPESDVESICKSASIYTMTSLYEGFGLALAEAMSCGLPCVAFDCPGGVSEIVVDEDTGYIVPVGNVQLFADRILKLIDDEELRYCMGDKARFDVKKYLPENVMPRWVDLFSEISSRVSDPFEIFIYK